MGSTISLGYILVCCLDEYYENTKLNKKFNAKMSLKANSGCNSVTRIGMRAAKSSGKQRFWPGGMWFDPYRA